MQPKHCLKTIASLLAAAYLLLAFGQAAAGEPKKMAFIVGVAKYHKKDFADLKYADEDAKDLSAELSRQGFQVTSLIGDAATRDAINAGLEKFCAQLKKLDKPDVALI